jgi:hypothetical protein
MSNQQAQSDRETLSALFDGELRGDSARFALKRLHHDAGWREACGRWQLAGDVLRGQAVAPAPAEFAGRVAAALHAEPAAAAGAVRSMRGRWIGGAALAASVAVAALFVTRPFAPAETTPASTVAAAPTTLESEAIGAGSSPRVATTPAGPESPVPGETSEPLAPTAGAGLAGVAAAVAEAPRRSGRRDAGDRAATRGTRQPAVSIVAAEPDTAVASVTAAGPLPDAGNAETLHPFLPAGEVVSRPWPRAVLPGHRGGGAFTASYDGASGSGEAPSFYPFEPDQLGATQDSGDPGRDAWPQP